MENVGKYPSVGDDLHGFNDKHYDFQLLLVKVCEIPQEIPDPAMSRIHCHFMFNLFGASEGFKGSWPGPHGPRPWMTMDPWTAS